MAIFQNVPVSTCLRAPPPNSPAAAVERDLMPLRYGSFVSLMGHRGAIDATACPSSTT
jgi:hypothetical protein